MQLFARLIPILALASLPTPQVQAYVVPTNQIIWREGIPIERAIDNLRELVVQEMSRNPGKSSVAHRTQIFMDVEASPLSSRIVDSLICGKVA